MMTIAIVQEWVVDDIVQIDESEYPNYAKKCTIAIDIDNLNPKPEVGWIFTGNALVPPTGYKPSMKITKLSFRERFTLQEMVALQVAKQNNPTLQVMGDNIVVATYIDLSRPDTIQGVELLVSLGLLTQDRANQILNTIPTSVELYQG
jgi:hypothetical protein